LEWLKLSDLALAQKVDYEEKYGPEENPAFKAFVAARAELSRIAWNSFASALRCDRGPIARTGLLWRPLEEQMAARLDDILQASPMTPLRRDDYAIGYLSNATQEQVDYLNTSNEYRGITPELTAALGELLATIGPEMEQALGHPFRIGSTIGPFRSARCSSCRGERVGNWARHGSGCATARRSSSIPTSRSG
jgi:hypothetical protein